MFRFRDSRGDGGGGVRVDVAFTDASLDLHREHAGVSDSLARLEAACGVRFARLHQVHGDVVHLVTEVTPLSPLTPVSPVSPVSPVPAPGTPSAELEGDGLVTTTRGLGLMVRAADCVPVVLADSRAGVVGAVHAGRVGVAVDVTSRVVQRMRDLGARELAAWIGPHICGGCYEVPEEMRSQVAARAPGAYAVSRTGTPALDIGAGVRAQLEHANIEVVEVGGCTREDAGLHSHRRDGMAAGRMAGLVWMS